MPELEYLRQVEVTSFNPNTLGAEAWLVYRASSRTSSLSKDKLCLEKNKQNRTKRVNIYPSDLYSNLELESFKLQLENTYIKVMCKIRSICYYAA